MKHTTCPLDCFDACSVIYEDGKLKGDSLHPVTKGSLCPNLNHYLQTSRIQKPRFRGQEISMDEAITILIEALQKVESYKSIYFKGQGSFGILQDAPAHFFRQFNAIFTKGSLCDGTGEAGIQAGRGESLSLPYEQIAQSSVVVVWGRNISVSNSHFMQLIKDKTLIVIDPVKTAIAKKADIHLQIRPRTDFELALLWARFVYIEDMVDVEFIENNTNDYEEFIDILHTFGIKKLAQRIDLDLMQMVTALRLMYLEKVSFLIGVGVQKYDHGDSVLRAIDSFAAMMGHFGKEGSGVSYLANSKLGFKALFPKGNKQVPIPTVDFGKYDLAFIQGSNPANQLPNTTKVLAGLEKCPYIVYFGLYENETSAQADLVIPALNFLEKEDMRVSYGTDFVGNMPKLIESDIGISEVMLTNKLCEVFGYVSLDDEQTLFAKFLNDNVYESNGYLKSKMYEKIPYSDGFYTDDGKFQFLDEYDDEYHEYTDYHLITCKHKYALNSQFKRDSYIYLPLDSEFREGDMVKAISPYGAYTFKVKIDESLREDCVKIYSGTPGVNFLTPDKISFEGNSAVYQETRINLSSTGIP